MRACVGAVMNGTTVWENKGQTRARASAIGVNTSNHRARHPLDATQNGQSRKLSFAGRQHVVCYFTGPGKGARALVLYGVVLACTI